MSFEDFGPIEILGVEDSFDKKGELCFLAGSSGEAYVERDEVVRLIEHLTSLVKDYDERTP